MKLVTLALTIICTLSIIGCNNNKLDNSVDSRIIYTTKMFADGRKTCNIDGYIFSPTERARIQTDFIRDEFLFIRYYTWDSIEWVLTYLDSIEIQFYLCDSIIDLNGDGKYEFVVQRFEGMGNVTDYYFNIYTENQSKMQKLLYFDTIPNCTLLPSNNSFSSVERFENSKIVKLYRWNNDLTFYQVKQQSIVCRNQVCVKETYDINGTNKVFQNQTYSNEIDDEYWGFLNWCKD